MGKKTTGKKKKVRYCFDNFKTARAECRERAMKNGAYGWPLCWESSRGYYCPTSDYGNGDEVIATVEKSGEFTRVRKEDAEFHRITKYTNPWYWEQHIKTFPTPQWKKAE